MITADWIAVGALAVFCVLGFAVGFGRGLKFFTAGVFGFIISLFVCYCIGGAVYKIPFVQQLTAKLAAALTGKNGFCDFLLKIRFEIIVYYLCLFVVVTIIREIIVAILKHVSKSERPVVSFINRTLGIFLFAAFLAMLTLIVFHIIELIGGSAEQNFYAVLENSKLRLDAIYRNNPLMEIIKAIRNAV